MSYINEVISSDPVYAQLHAAAIPAIRRLVDVGQTDTGQAEVCRAVLLGLYNGSANPFDLTELRRLDADLRDAAFAVMKLDAYRCVEEVHCLVPDCESTIRRWGNEARERRKAAS